MYIWAQKLTPKHLISRIVGKLANTQIVWIKNKIILWFIKKYRVDLSEAVITDPKQYPSFNLFFTRLLKPEARPQPTEPTAIACPVDGTVSEAGLIQQQQLFQAKGHYYDLNGLLGGHSERTAQFQNGHFFTAYLAPKDYHRVHFPVDATLESMVHMPGSLFSVNPYTTHRIPQLFSKNERVVCYFKTSFGPMAVIMVGALLVASMTLRWHGTVTPPTSKTQREWSYSSQVLSFVRGEELGFFQLGSTVILLFARQPGLMTWNSDLTAGASLRLGQVIGSFLEPVVQ